jgi:hypothetical protein
VRDLPAGAAIPLAPLPVETDASPPRGLCGTRAEAVVELLQDALARPLADPLPTPHSVDAGEIAVLEDDGTFFYTNKNNNPMLDLAAVARAFYRTHGDDYDFLAIYLASGLDTWLGSPGALAAAYVVRNKIGGIGLDFFDFGTAFDSPERLSMIMSMNGLHRYPADPDSNIGGDTFSTLDVLAHELGHRWLAYTYVDSGGVPSPALLGRDYEHWNFFLDSDASLEEGCDWAVPAPDSFLTDAVTEGFSPLDQYLMGLRPAAEVDSFFVVGAPSDFDPPGTYVIYTSPFVGLGCRGEADYWNTADIVRAHGPRIPAAPYAPHAFRMAMVLVVPRGSDATAADLAEMDTLQARFVPYFAAATSGRGSIDLSLDSHAGSVRIAHQPLKDTEDVPSPRPVGARVTIAQAGIPLTVDPSSVRAFWRPAGGGAFSEIPLAAAGPDSFAGLLPGLGASGTVEYYLYASSDSAGIEAYDPPGGAASPHTYSAGPDLTPPVIQHTPLTSQGVDRMPQRVIARVTDNLGVDSVWVEYRLDVGSAGSIPANPAGRDSFNAWIGIGFTSGRWVAYRFMARDRSAAGNTTASNPAYDTLRVGLDWVNDFENGSDGWYHMSYLFSFRDAWQVSGEQSSPGGGVSWKCGSPDGEAYPPHLDACLYSPLVYGIVPGTKLYFDHRYALEQADAYYAWDGARVEAQVGSGPWQVLEPQPGYTHEVAGNGGPLGPLTPCWSGDSGGWRTESVDLSALAPGPARLRFRMGTDDFLGDGGWFVDRIRVDFPETPTSVAPIASAPSVAAPWPNPTRGMLRLSAVLPRSASAEWSLYDLAGRRVATLWKGTVPAGGYELAAELPRAMPSGLYFAHLALDGRAAASHRVIVLR